MRLTKPAVLYAVVSVIGLLLLVNIFLLIANSREININKEVQENAARIKITTSEIMRNVHVLDLGLRGHALTENPQINASQDEAIALKDLLFDSLEKSLIRQHFPMEKFHALRDTINNYFTVVASMEKMINEGRKAEFMTMINKDLGYDVWVFHETF